MRSGTRLCELSRGFWPPFRCLRVWSGPREKPRARDLGVPLEGVTGPLNAITDVPGVQVGHATIIRGEAALAVGKGPVRTGVTAILPRGKTFDPVFAARYVLNGNGELTGTTWIDESGFLETPILITNTFSVGVVRDAALAWMERRNYKSPVYAWVTRTSGWPTRSSAKRSTGS